MKLLIAILSCLALAACASKQTPEKIHVSNRAPDPQPASILFIGNSYSFHVPGELRRIAARDGVKLRAANTPQTTERCTPSARAAGTTWSSRSRAAFPRRP
ncbi:MAG: hypothetical protein MUC40_03740 [Akkermansiaceae bacterium]|nr:hypothetical protein [Akkermansiaceae bacterium]